MESTSFLPPTAPGEEGHRARANGLGHQYRVYDVDDAVRLHDVGDGDPGAAALRVHYNPTGAALDEAEIFALNSLQRCGAVMARCHGRDLSGGNAAGNHVIGEDAGERSLVLWLHQGVDRAGGKFGKGCIGGCKTVNGPLLDSVSTKPDAFTAATSVV